MKKKIPVVAVFDIGKTNKKLLLFDSAYNLVEEQVRNFAEIADNDGFPCEDISALADWILLRFDLLKQSKEYDLKAVNFSTYGASLVYLDDKGKRIGYLYNYLKPYPQSLQDNFLSQQGGLAAFSQSTSSPVMGHLNAGMQLYWLKIKRPELYNSVKTVLHLPQYLSYLITGKMNAEMTSLGCHSVMWNFEKMEYHNWLEEEGMKQKLASVIKGSNAVNCINEYNQEVIVVGTGLHDSSAATIPYLTSFKDPFTIISTGTWVVNLNPFNKELPTSLELEKGCLSYLTFEGNPVKTTMLFSGNDHEQQITKIAAYFNVDAAYLKTLDYDATVIEQLKNKEFPQFRNNADIDLKATSPCAFHKLSLDSFDSAEQAYHQLLVEMVIQQAASTAIVLGNSTIANIYVDGGFCNNKIYMQLLANAFPSKKVFKTTMIQGTALGAALILHHQWNGSQLPQSLITLKEWSPL